MSSPPTNQPTSKMTGSKQTLVIIYLLLAILVADIIFELLQSVLNTYVFRSDVVRPWQWVIVAAVALILLWAYGTYVVKIPLIEAFNPSDAIEKDLES